MRQRQKLPRLDAQPLPCPAKDHEFDAIVVTGVSGLLLGPTLAYLLGKRLGVVRKTMKDSHAITGIEHNMEPADSWIFVDDLVASGETIKRVEEAMEDVGFKRMQGRYLYNRDAYEKGGWRNV